MKKILIAVAIVVTTLTLHSCGTAGSTLAESLLQNGGGKQNQTTQTLVNSGTGILDNVLSGLFSRSPLTQKELVGTWNYTGSDAVFESENLLAQAGGTIIASQIEGKVDAQLAKYGIKKGVTRFVFNRDNTFNISMGGRNFGGTYQFDEKSRTLTLSTMMGLMTLSPKVARTTGGISVLFEADKLLTLASGVSSLLGQSNTQMGVLSGIISNYSGLRLGLQMKRG